MFIELSREVWEKSSSTGEVEDMIAFFTSVAAAVNQSGNGTARICQQGYETLFVVSDGEDTDSEPIGIAEGAATLRSILSMLELVGAKLELYPRFGLEFEEN